MMTYISQEDKDKTTIAAKTIEAYGIVNPSSLTYPISMFKRDDGNMTLEQFGDLFRQKLDALYVSYKLL